MARKTPAEGATAAAPASGESSSSSSAKGSGGSSAASAKAAAAAARRPEVSASIFSNDVIAEPTPAAAGSSRQPTGPGDDR